MTELRDLILQQSKVLGINPVDLATVMSYETGGTFDPWQAGPTTKWGQHRGLIQMGEPQRQQHGYHRNTPLPEKMEAVAKYLTSAGVRPGMGLLDVYSAINAGGVGRYNARDAAAGGVPGTVRDKVTKQMGGHKAKAMALLGGKYDPSPSSSVGSSPSSVSPDNRMAIVNALLSQSEGDIQLPNTVPVSVQGPEASATLSNISTTPIDVRSELAEPIEGTNMDVPTPRSNPRRGSNINTINYIKEDPGEKTRLATEESIAQKQALARQMLNESLGIRRIEHPLQGAAQMAQAAMGGLINKKASNQEEQRRAALAEALMGVYSGDSSAPLDPSIIEKVARVDPKLAITLAESRKPPVPEPYTLGSDQIRYGPNNEVLATGPKSSSTTKREMREGPDGVLRYVDDQSPVFPGVNVPEGRFATPEEVKAQNLPDGTQWWIQPEGEWIRKQDTDVKSPERQQQDEAVSAASKESPDEAGLKAEATERGKSIPSMMQPIAEDYTNADEFLKTSQRLGELLSTTDTGARSAAIDFLRSNFGIELTDDAGNIQAVQALVQYLTPRMRVPGSGSTSDREMAAFASSLPSLLGTPDGNNLVLQTIGGLAQRRVNMSQIAQDYIIGDVSGKEAIAKMRALPDPFVQFKSWQEKTGSVPKDATREIPAVGEVVDGHKFLGGDPNNQANWEEVR